MAIDVRIVDGVTGQSVRVVKPGTMAVSPVVSNLAVFKELGTINTAFNFYQPKGGKNFLISHIFAYGDKQVAGNTNATVEIYEATSATTTTVDKIILQFEIGQNEFHPFQDLNLLVSKNRFINAKTDDSDIHMNILGFFVKL